MTKNRLALVGLHLLGNALLLLLGYYWLGVSESDGLHLFWSFALLLLIVSGAVWLHGSSLAFFHESRELGNACGLAARHLLPLLVLAVLAASLYAALGWLLHSFDHTAFTIASFLTMKTRRPLAPENVLRLYRALIWALRWLVCPALLFMAAADIAHQGWHGFRWRRRSWLRSLLLSAAVCTLMLVALVLPLKLFLWVPAFGQFGMQMASLIARVTLAYLLFVFALLSIEFLTSAGKPVRSQPSTVSSP